MDRLDPAVMSAPSSSRATLLDIPQKDLAVASYTGKPRIVGSNGHVVDGVAMRLVPLDRRVAFYRRRRIVRIAGHSPREVYGAV